MASCSQKDHTHMQCQLPSRRILLSSFNGWKWSNMLKLPSSMQFWNTWNCYPLSTLLSNAPPQAKPHNQMVQVAWNNSQMLPSSLQCVTYSALQEKIKTIAKFKPQLKYKASAGNTFHNISPIKSLGNIQKKILNTSYMLKYVWTKKCINRVVLKMRL